MCLITINDSFRPVFMKLYNRHEDYLIQYITVFSLNVVKKPIVDEGIFSETELGIIGSVLFFTYAIGKFTEGNPMLSGVSWKNFQTINAPINPTIPAPKKPYRQPNTLTIEAIIRKVNASPILWLADQKP